MRSLVLFLCILLDIFSQDKLSFSKKEVEYLRAKKIIKMCNNPDWVPIEYKEAGSVSGIAIDMIMLLKNNINSSANLTLDIKHIPTKSWKESQIYLKNRKCDILTSAIQTDKRREYAFFTKPYLDYTLVIITNKDAPFIASVDTIKDKIIARKQGSGLIKKLKKRYKNIQILETKGYKESFDAVSRGRAYATIATLPVASYYISKYGYSNLKIAGHTNMNYKLSIAVRNDDKILFNILNKTLNHVTKQEQTNLFSKWSRVTFTKKVDYSTIIWIVAVIGLVILFVIYRQIRLKRQEKELKKNLKSFQELLESTIEGVIISDKSGKCIYANKMVEKIFGFDENEMLGKYILSFVPDKYLQIAKSKLQQKSIEPYEIELKRKNNTVFPAIIRGRDIIYQDQKVRVSSVLDITKLKKLENELKHLNKNLQKKVEEQIIDIKKKEQLLQQQSKLAAMGEMIGAIAHQWRQPLNTLGLLIQDIEEAYEFNELDENYIKEMVHNSMEQIKFMSKTIDDFRNFFRLDKKKELFSIKKAITETLRLQNAQLKNHYINVSVNIDDFLVNGYESEFKQVILNLINNAKDAILDNNKTVRNITITAKNNTVSIEDTGGGIQEQIIDRIFEPYFTTKEQGKGTGLGLYMSKMIIENNLGGKLTAKNVDGGVMFIMDFNKIINK